MGTGARNWGGSVLESRRRARRSFYHRRPRDARRADARTCRSSCAEEAINLSNINRILRTKVTGHTVRLEKIHPRHEKRVFRPPFRAVWMTAPVELKFGADLTQSHSVLPRMSAFAAHQVTARLAARAVHRLVKVRSPPMTVHPGARPRPPHPRRIQTSAGSLLQSLLPRRSDRLPHRPRADIL